ncbi:XRE family transcriptional regulator [Agrobacterium rhizogenes]|uniref:helix-turn-helix domain-containing protein n=1 Tax=Rhizobium rhizogenes TaxID=359 RepID=UPI00115DC9AB|nr:helix-turn-helix transcriptional regulator [Rhizobium rhizogenes]NTG25054.1 XRE family transcriptional regulator [Rhizobium rhizogenes]NTH42757.1 XRE family transcriptional regulator [Rhizobium rhizogenes]NTH55375.1 XRE family transcriptional regulator [Rhizobium rhizogenes]NTH74956.1 XRE family transcriptional regulator [Rhizobium rhizogenes]NTJ04905.1 XRE family transcriptional regulator [Rhizobium rhizogenes]
MDDLDRLINDLPADERRAVEKRAEALMTAQSLRELRVLAGQTQEQVSARTGFKQTNVSRLEKRADMKLSTLRDYVESLGGTLKIVADIAGKKVDLSSITERSRHGSNGA